MGKGSNKRKEEMKQGKWETNKDGWQEKGESSKEVTLSYRHQVNVMKYKNLKYLKYVRSHEIEIFH